MATNIVRKALREGITDVNEIKKRLDSVSLAIEFPINIVRSLIKIVQNEHYDPIKDLTRLAEDLYEEGYICGIKSGEDKWFEAYARVMYNVAHGERYYNDYDNDSVLKTYRELENE